MPYPAVGARDFDERDTKQPDTTRRVVAGRHGLSYAVVGAVVEEAP